MRWTGPRLRRRPRLTSPNRRRVPARSRSAKRRASLFVSMILGTNCGISDADALRAKQKKKEEEKAAAEKAGGGK